MQRKFSFLNIKLIESGLVNGSALISSKLIPNSNFGISCSICNIVPVHYIRKAIGSSNMVLDCVAKDLSFVRPNIFELMCIDVDDDDGGKWNLVG